MFDMLTVKAGRSCSLLRMYVLTRECKVFCSVSAGALLVLLSYLLYAVPQWQTDAESMIQERLYLLRALRSAQQEVNVFFQCYYPLHYIVNCLCQVNNTITW